MWLTKDKKTGRIDLYGKKKIEVSDKFECFEYAVSEDEKKKMESNRYDVYFKDTLEFVPNDLFIADEKEREKEEFLQKAAEGKVKEEDIIEYLKTL